MEGYLDVCCFSGKYFPTQRCRTHFACGRYLGYDCHSPKKFHSPKPRLRNWIAASLTTIKIRNGAHPGRKFSSASEGRCDAGASPRNCHPSGSRGRHFRGIPLVRRQARRAGIRVHAGFGRQPFLHSAKPGGLRDNSQAGASRSAADVLRQSEVKYLKYFNIGNWEDPDPTPTATYQQYIDGIQDRLPPDLRRLCNYWTAEAGKAVYLNDGRIRSIQVMQEAASAKSLWMANCRAGSKS